MRLNRLIRGKRLAACIALAAACLAPCAQASSVLPLYLDQVIDQAATAFEGTCTGNRTERDPATNLVVTYTTFQVREALKGNAGTTYTIKQIGGTLPDEGLQYRVSGVPSFEPGQDYVVFLAGVSSAGFSSPIGLAQGRFTITSDAGGSHVGNGRDFKDMASRMAAELPPKARALVTTKSSAELSQMDLLDFKQAVRNHLGGAR